MKGAVLFKERTLIPARSDPSMLQDGVVQRRTALVVKAINLSRWVLVSD